MAEQAPEVSVNGWNADYIESLYRRWLDHPDEIDEQWRQFFQGFDLAARMMADGEPVAGAAPPVVDEHAIRAAGIDVAHTKQDCVGSLIYHYRDIGHLAAALDPLGEERPFPEQLTLESFGLADGDLEESFEPGHLPLDNPSKLADIIQVLEDTYCRTVGVEYMHIQDREVRRWLQKRMETVRNRPALEPEHRLQILDGLTRAHALEQFLDRRYKGKKWFSLGGAESLIPLLNEMVELGPRNGVEEFTLGMAHRGRVNILVNIMDKTYEELFTEFHESWNEDYLEGGGDVKYHRGYSSDHVTSGGQTIRLTAASNPSHLEFVDPVVLGRTRAKQRLRHNEESRDKVVPILIHGDASFPGQGIVAECFNMVKLDGYTVGGTVHIIINNQIGFTTNPQDARSGRYCTDLAKMVDAPIFHVNGDDPESCAFVARLALEYRQTFGNDVVIDMWCYRRFGHNESDEPAFTQPLMYAKIKKHPPVFELYSQRLIREGVIDEEQLGELRDTLREKLDSAQMRSKDEPVDPAPDPFSRAWAGLQDNYVSDEAQTTVSPDNLKRIGAALGAAPDDFTPHPKIKKNVLAKRGTAVKKGEPLDWAMGELLAYGSLLLEGHAVRLTGQDVERGTFAHRHAVIFDVNTGEGYTPLNHIDPDQARFCVHNSPLSEQSCVGFEYGYSLADPQMLVVWEAQFGDFANGAQVVFDQFIASAEVKWQRYSGLVLLLPHGYEGQGPEHSSARLERFLQLCADDDMQVIYPTTPAQIFHALRRQLKRSFRKPLVVMSPKSLLRHRQAVSTVKDLTDGRFQLILDDPSLASGRKAGKVERVILCSGKIYYDLLAERTTADRDQDVALVRLEQLYPFPHDDVETILNRYENATEYLWVQEEPLNAGAFRFVEPILREEFEIELIYVGRDASATPAVGSSMMHAEEQAEILSQAMAQLEEEDEEEAEQEGSTELTREHIATAD